MPQVTRREIVLGCTAAVALSQAGAAKASAEELAMDATGQAELVRKGEISAGELVDRAIRRIEQLNPRVNAVVWERFDKARGEARAVLPRGPFTGVPFLTSWARHMGERTC